MSGIFFAGDKAVVKGVYSKSRHDETKKDFPSLYNEFIEENAVRLIDVKPGLFVMKRIKRKYSEHLYFVHESKMKKRYFFEDENYQKILHIGGADGTEEMYIGDITEGIPDTYYIDSLWTDHFKNTFKLKLDDWVNPCFVPFQFREGFQGVNFSNGGDTGMELYGIKHDGALIAFKN